MSNLSLKYYTFLSNHSTKYEKILSNVRTNIQNLKDSSLIINFSDFDQKNTDRYLRYFNILDEKTIGDRYNQLKIINATNMSYNQMINSISSEDVITLLNNIRNSNNTDYNVLTVDYNFITNYLLKFSEYYDKNLFIYHYMTDNYYKNISSLLDGKFDFEFLSSAQRAALIRISFFHMFFLRNFLNYLFCKKSNLKNVLALSLNPTNLLDSLNLFSLVLEEDSFVENVVRIILNNQYQFGKVSDSFVNSIVNELNDKIFSLKNIFLDYFDSNIDIFSKRLVESIHDFFINSFSFEFFNNIFNQQNIFNFVSINLLSYKLYLNESPTEFRNIVIKSSDYTENLSLFEDQIIQLHEKNLNNFYSIKDYLYSLYLVRDNSFRFVNSIDYLFSNYVFNHIRQSDIYYFSNFGHLKKFFFDWVECIYLNNFKRELDNFCQDLSYLDFKDDIVKFSLVFELFNIIEDFIFESEEFKKYIYDVKYNIYRYLRKNGFVESDFNWCEENTSLTVYILSYLKEHATNTESDYLKAYLEECLNLSLTDTYLVSNGGEILYLAKDFIDLYAENMYKFYDNFMTSFIGDMFSKEIHSIYRK